MTIQRNWQHRVHKTKTNKTKTQYALDTTMRRYNYMKGRQTLVCFMVLKYWCSSSIHTRF